MIAKRIEEITSFIVMDVLEKANEMERHGLDVVHLEVGQPDFETPGCIKQAAEKALRDGYTHYTHSQGIMELRQAICEDYEHQYGVNIDPEQIIVTSGTSPAMMILFSVLLEPSDEIIISDPHYACYPNFIKFFQGIPAT
ncbi:MAG TPA: aminotransferase class I/II-fold pyridoxal phosphate-dependent enzyme, partial [Desulfohalobiaceae bacterium]|nr:aminotransferase class I/II-fold pyridoxal phosphate-dependent enzyme [Desulfohalobiaceae bacterium]